MGREPIPEDLRRFLLTSVPSVPFVEALLLLRERRDGPLDAEYIARRIYVSPRAAADVIAQLEAASIAQRAEPAGVRFAPATPELAAMIEQLAHFYRTHLVDVTDVIHDRTARKAQQFADAFKLRKDS